MCNETYLFVAAIVEKALSPKGGIGISGRVVFSATFFLDGNDMKLVLFCINVASHPDQTVFVPLQDVCIRDFPLRVEIRK